MGTTTDIVTTAIITDIIILAATTGTAFGLPVPVGIIAIGKRRRLWRARPTEGWRRQAKELAAAKKKLLSK